MGLHSFGKIKLLDEPVVPEHIACPLNLDALCGLLACRERRRSVVDEYVEQSDPALGEVDSGLVARAVDKSVADIGARAVASLSLAVRRGRGSFLHLDTSMQFRIQTCGNVSSEGTSRAAYNRSGH